MQKKLVAMVKHQLDFFNDHSPRLLEGFVYREELLTPDEELDLVSFLKDLPFREFEYQGFLGKRRVVSFGWRYDLWQQHSIPAVEKLRYSITWRKLKTAGRTE